MMTAQTAGSAPALSPKSRRLSSVPVMALRPKLLAGILARIFGNLAQDGIWGKLLLGFFNPTHARTQFVHALRAVNNFVFALKEAV
jgi:hypothetical protein